MREWVSFAQRTLEDVAHDTDQASSFRRNVFRVWRLLSSAPAPVTNLKSRITENEIEKLAKMLEEAPKGPYKTAIEMFGGCQDVVQRLTLTLGYARFLDREAFEHRPPNVASTDPDHFITSIGVNDTGFVFAYPARRSDRQLREQVPLTARGILYHRVLPQRLTDKRCLRLIGLKGSDGAPFEHEGELKTKLAGTLFTRLEAITEDVPGGFLVTAVQGDDLDGTLKSALSRASGCGCEVLLFPELTIDPVRRKTIQNHLQESSRSRFEGRCGGPMFVIAGSWHDRLEDGKHGNIAPIFDRWGIQRGAHQKFAIYSFPGGKVEAVEPGEQIACVVTRLGIFAVAICLDFCNTAEGSPYYEIDADYVLVISMGNDATMQGHINNARGFYTRWRGRTFVIQQGIDGSTKYVLKMEHADTPQPEVEDTMTALDWEEWLA